MFDKIKIKRFDERTIQLSFDSVSITVTCFKDNTMITTKDFDYAGVSGQPDQIIGDNGVWLRNRIVK